MNRKDSRQWPDLKQRNKSETGADDASEDDDEEEEEGDEENNDTKENSVDEDFDGGMSLKQPFTVAGLGNRIRDIKAEL